MVALRHSPPSEQVRARMSAQRRSDTAPELALRHALHRLGLRYRLHRRDLPGTPDIVFVTTRVAVFVDGCFWHGCPQHAVSPKANADWWDAKLRRNRERDREKDAGLEELGWLAVHVWEHENMAEAALDIEALVRSRAATCLANASTAMVRSRTD